jgi:hypothetical protein
MKDAAKQAGQPQKPGHQPQPGRSEGAGPAQGGAQINESGPFKPPARTKIEETVLAPLRGTRKFRSQPARCPRCINRRSPCS